ncbi:MAG: ABC transporter ATP-binding protein [Chloroflexota bacterium]|nr:ABC transporter ATP-binding protein [Chloroflexota bacterium]
MKDLTKAFGGLIAVNSASFEVEAGEIVGLIGPNGAGKSTIFEVISGFYAPTKGSIFFDDKRLDGLKPHQVLERGVARTFQLVETLPSFTIFDFILVPALLNLPLSKARQRTKEIIDLLGIEAKAEQLTSSLVPAEQKMVELGRVLSSQPQMVLLDEVMAGLSGFEATPIISLIKRLNKEGVTFLIVEHRLELIRELCHRVLVLDFGEIIAEGSPEEVMSNRKVIEAYIGWEAEGA